VLHYLKGTLAMAHNGNLVNSPELMRELSRTGAIFQTTTDSELIAYEIARARINTGSVEEAVSMAMNRLKGSYSLVIMSPRKLIGARDPFGIRPLCIGKRGKAWFFASESCALDTVGAEFVRDVEPGEIVTISPRFGLHSDRSHCIRNGKTARCVFEYIYFGRADSVIDKVSVYNSRLMAGRFLAKDSPVDADLVIGVPESGSVAALGFSMESGIPYGQGFVKNGYIGRTFIRPQQQSRESAVRVKLNPLRQAVEGKRVVMIDDSIVRGTTSDRIVRMLREAGATEVHMRVSSPPFLYPCYFGTDIPEREQLIAYNRTQEEVRGVIGADSLAYLKMERLGQIVEDLPVCNGCFTGKYPVDPPTEDIRGEYER
jgi:amidophosphoribosyltransferase